MFEYFLLAFFSGILVKLADDLEDLKRKTILHYGKFAIALAYGAIIGFLISQSGFGLLFLGALLAQLAAKKIDNSVHALGFLSAFVAAFILGFPVLEALPLVIFAIFAFLDEQELRGALKVFTEYRLFLKLAALVFVIAGIWDYFIAVIAFDVGYFVSSFAAGTPTLAKSREKPKKAK